MRYLSCCQPHNDTDVGEKLVSFRKWAKEHGAPRKTSVSLEVDDIIELWQETVQSVKMRIHRKRCQVHAYNEDKSGLKEGEILLHVDFSESYKSFQSRMKFSRHTLANVVSAFLSFVCIF